MFGDLKQMKDTFQIATIKGLIENSSSVDVMNNASYQDWAKVYEEKQHDVLRRVPQMPTD